MIYDVNGTPTGIAYYDTVEAMKAAAPAVGTVVATGGYYTKGDGGAAMYSVSDAAGATVNGCTSFTGGGRAFEMLDDGRELNVLQCGMHTDGVTDNLAIFGLIKAVYPVRTLYFPKGVYAFAGAIVFDRCYCVLDNAELKCTSPGIIGRFVEIRGQMYPPEHPQDDMFIRGNGIINANFKANTCLAVARQKHTLIDGVHIKNFQRYGIMSKFTDDSLGQNLSYELEVTDCLITNELSYANATGICDFNDSTYTDIVILNVKTAIQASGSSVFHNIHAWCYDFDNSANRAELLTGTVFARITDNGARFSDCYCDTYQKGFVLANNISLAYVSNFKWFINLETWPDGVTPVAFNAGTNKTEYKVFGARVPKQGITKFSDVSLTGTGCEFYGVVSDADNAPTGIIDDDVIANGKAWSSKHTVDKLLPMQTVTGNPVAIETLEGYPLELSASWEPKQDGSGTPSPDNVRPITGGRDSVKTTVNGTEHTLALPDTIYGGEVDAVTGAGNANKKILTVDGDKIKFIEAGLYWNLPLHSASNVGGSHVYATSHFPTALFAINKNYEFIFTMPESMKPYFATIEEFNTYLSAQYAAGTPMQIVYELAAPESFAATGGGRIYALAGTNTISTDADTLTATAPTPPQTTASAAEAQSAAAEAGR